MDTNEIEKKLKEKFSHISPSRMLFENTLNKYVTNIKEDRFISMKGSKFINYKLIIHNIVNKKVLIGLPVIVFAVVTIVFITKSQNGIDQVVNNNLPPNNQIENVSNNTNDLIVNKNIKEDLSSIDSILASFDNDVTSDSIIANNEYDNIKDIMAELENYNNIKKSNYEETI